MNETDKLKASPRQLSAWVIYTQGNGGLTNVAS
jgi:hypothetical protein